MLETILGVFTSGGMGAIVGLAGSIAVKWLEYKTLGQKLAFEKSMALIRMKEAEMEMTHALALADKQMEIAQVEGEIQKDVAEMAAFAESQKAGQQMYGGWVDKLRGAMRPSITIYLLIVTTALTAMLWNTLGGLETMPVDKLQDLFVYLVYSAVFLTLTATTWWFGSRPSQQVKLKN